MKRVLVRTAAGCGVALVLTMTVRAQTAASPAVLPNYVASVKAADPNGLGVMMRNMPGLIEMNGVPLNLLLRQAYQIQEVQIVGAPSWLTSDRFDIQIKMEGVTTPQPAVTQAVMRAVLAERFNFKAHNESREMPVYALVAARADGKLGPGLTPSAAECAAMVESRGRGAGPGGAPGAPAAGPGAPPPGGFGSLGPGGGPGRNGRVDGPPDFNQPEPCGSMGIGPGMQKGSGMRIAALLPFFSQQTGRVVVDRTGLTGVYDIDLHWTPDVGRGGPGGPLGPPPPGAPSLPAIDPNGPSLMTAVQEQLGLKLESQRAPVDVLVIDRVEHPAGN